MRDAKRVLTDFERECLHWRGRLLSGAHRHRCRDWDLLPVDETCPEWPCICFAVPTGNEANDVP